MKPLATVITNVNIMVRDVLASHSHRYPRFIVSAHVPWLLIAFFASDIPAATTVVTVRDPVHNRVFIAADSMARHQRSPDDLRCKIHIITNDCVFAMAGMYENRIPPFDLFSFGESACRSPGDLKQRADAFLLSVFPAIRSVTGALAKNEPDYFKQFIGKPVVEVLFVGNYNGRLSIFARGVILLPNGNLKPETAEAVSDNDYFFAGANQEIKAYVNSHPGIWKRGVIAAARRLVAIEIDAYPGIVAEPISILTVYASGHRGWINPGKCNGGHADMEPSKGNPQKPSQRRKH